VIGQFYPSKYQIEETFWIYGLDNTTERSTISEK
jgi:hypothetical protein